MPLFYDVPDEGYLQGKGVWWGVEPGHFRTDLNYQYQSSERWIWVWFHYRVLPHVHLRGFSSD